MVTGQILLQKNLFLFWAFVSEFYSIVLWEGREWPRKSMKFHTAFSIPYKWPPLRPFCLNPYKSIHYQFLQMSVVIWNCVKATATLRVLNCFLLFHHVVKSLQTARVIPRGAEMKPTVTDTPTSTLQTSVLLQALKCLESRTVCTSDFFSARTEKKVFLLLWERLHVEPLVTHS